MSCKVAIGTGFVHVFLTEMIHTTVYSVRYLLDYKCSELIWSGYQVLKMWECTWQHFRATYNKVNVFFARLVCKTLPTCTTLSTVIKPMPSNSTTEPIWTMWSHLPWQQHPIWYPTFIHSPNTLTSEVGRHVVTAQGRSQQMAGWVVTLPTNNKPLLSFFVVTFNFF